MTATATRILHAVPDAPVILESVTPVGRRKQLAAERKDALRALNAPEVIEEQQAAIASTLRRLAYPKADRRKVLADLAEAMLVLGYMNSSADQRNAPYLRLTEQTLAETGAMETVERKEARDAEKTFVLKAVAQ